MQFLKNNMWSIFCLTLIAFMGFSGDALANNNDVMGTAQTKAMSVFVAVKKIVFVLGGFGLIALAFMAIFGKLDWKKFAALATGLAILAAAGAIVEYATEDDNFTNGHGGFADSFGTTERR